MCKGPSIGGHSLGGLVSDVFGGGFTSPFTVPGTNIPGLTPGAGTPIGTAPYNIGAGVALASLASGTPLSSIWSSAGPEGAAGAPGVSGAGGFGTGADWLSGPGAADPTAYMGVLGGGETGVGGLGMLGKGLIYGSGLLGMYQSQQMMKLAKQAQAQADPFGPYRGAYAKELGALEADPSSITSRPGYQFTFDQGNQALQRMLAAGGLLGSGNALVEAQKYGQGFAGQYLTQEEQRLAGLAGANIAPNPAIGLQGYGMGSDLASRALATIGYGMTV